MKKFIVSMLVAIGLASTAIADGHHRYVAHRPVVCNQPVRYYASPRCGPVVYSTPFYSRPFRRVVVVERPQYIIYQSSWDYDYVTVYGSGCR